MRDQPNQNYSPMTPKCSNMTVYEMAQSMDEGGDAQVGFPALIKWLLHDFYKNYTFDGQPYDIGYIYNIAYFTVYNFINREICSKKPEVFRTKYLKELVNMNLNSDFLNILKDIKNSTAELTRVIEFNEGKKNTVTHNTTDTTTLDQTGSVKNNTDAEQHNGSTSNQTIDITNTVNNTTTENNSGTQTINGSSKTTQDTTTRVVNTDYPQSTVNKEDIGKWEYASSAVDTENGGSTTTTDNSTTTNNAENSRSDNGTTKNTGTTNNSTVNNGKQTQTSSTDVTQNNTTVLSRTGDETGSETTNNSTRERYSNISGFELNASQLKIFDDYRSFYDILLKKLENCFISVYVEEDRDGWLDPTVNLMSLFMEEV